MPLDIKKWATVPVALEHPLIPELTKACNDTGMSRLKFLRMCVKYVLSSPTNIKAVIAAGDPPVKEA